MLEGEETEGAEEEKNGSAKNSEWRFTSF